MEERASSARYEERTNGPLAQWAGLVAGLFVFGVTFFLCPETVKLYGFLF